MNKESARRAALHGRTLARVTDLRETIQRLENVLVSQKGAVPGTDAFALQRDLGMARLFFHEWTLVLSESGPIRLLKGDLKEVARAEWVTALDVPATVIAKKYSVSVRTMLKLFGRRTGGEWLRVPDEVSAAIDEALQEDATDIEIARSTGANPTTVRLHRFKKLVASGDHEAIAKELHKKTSLKLLALPDTDAFEDSLPPYSPLRRYGLIELSGKGMYRLTELGRLVKRILPEVMGDCEMTTPV
jgi:hypothetical protein